MSTTSRAALFLLCLVLVFAGPGSAQTTTSILQGKVTDSTGAVLPGVSVEVKGATVTRQVVTDTAGLYRAVALPAGTYTIAASKTGFKTREVQSITLVLDRTVDLDVVLEIAPRAESITVTSAMPLIDTTTASTRQVIDARTIDTVPLNGRNYLDLIRLSPGVVVNTTVRATGGTNLDTSGAIMGERAGNTSYLADGFENNDDFRGGVLQALTQDAVQEFEVISSGYKSEFGRGSGGVVNVITKSGTDSFHGSGFLFLRNDALDSSNVQGQDPPKLSRYDYGFTLGGPVRKQKSWFFGSLERVQETRGAIFPPDIPPQLTANENFSRQPQSKDLRGLGKYNQRLNDKNDLAATVSWTRSELLNDLASPISLPSASNNSLANTVMGTISLTTIFSPRMFLNSSFGVRRQDFDQNQQSGAGGRGYVLYLLDAGAEFAFGPPPGSVQTYNQRYYSGREALSFYVGERHSAKIGFEYTRSIVGGVQGEGLEYSLVTVQSLFDLYGLQSFMIPQGTAFLNPGDNLVRLRNNGLSWFAQDDWKARDNLTFNLGVRYDYDSRFNASKNFAPRLGLIWSPDKKTAINASWGMFYDRYRLGLAQAVRALGGFNGRSVIEFDYPRLADDAVIPFPGSLGEFAVTAGDPYFLNTQFNIPNGSVVGVDNVQSLTGMTPTNFLTAVNNYLSGFGIPFVPVEFSTSTGYLRQDQAAMWQDEILVAQPFRTPYNNTFTVGVQRELTRELSFGASYVRRSIRDILGLRIPNLAYDSRTAGIPITTDGGLIRRVYGPWYSGKYDALVLKVEKRFGRRFQMQANYVYARSTDDLLNSNLAMGIGAQGGSSVPTDNLNLEFDRGNSDLFVPHSFVASGYVALPIGFRVSGIYHATSGMYFSASGTPTDYDGDGIFSTRPPGTKRNQFRGPASSNVDLRVEKRFKFGERFAASGLAEFFNLTNARNPELIDNFYVNNAPGPNFGKVRVPLPGREVQFGLRFEF